MSRPTTGRILQGDVTAVLKRLPSASVDCVVTSPPYFRLRNYRIAGQLGLEVHVGQWVNHLTAVLDEPARVLVPTGTAWLNLGDRFSRHRRDGAPTKRLLLAPERLAIALIDDGWLIRNKIVWAKRNPMPTRPRPARLHLGTALPAGALSGLLRRPRRRPGAAPLQAPKPKTMPPERHRGELVKSDSRPRRRLALGKAAGRVGHHLGKNPGDVWTSPPPASPAVRTSRSSQRRSSSDRSWSAVLSGAALAADWRGSDAPPMLGHLAVRGELGPICGCDEGAIRPVSCSIPSSAPARRRSSPNGTAGSGWVSSSTRLRIDGRETTASRAHEDSGLMAA